MWIQGEGRDWTLKTWFTFFTTEDQASVARNTLCHTGTGGFSESGMREENVCTLIMGHSPRSDLNRQPHPHPHLRTGQAQRTFPQKHEVGPKGGNQRQQFQTIDPQNKSTLVCFICPGQGLLENCDLIAFRQDMHPPFQSMSLPFSIIFIQQLLTLMSSSWLPLACSFSSLQEK